LRVSHRKHFAHNNVYLLRAKSFSDKLYLCKINGLVVIRVLFCAQETACR